MIEGMMCGLAVVKNCNPCQIDDSRGGGEQKECPQRGLQCGGAASEVVVYTYGVLLKTHDD